MKNLIQVQELTKCYGKTKAVENLNFVVNKNEIVGFLGENGAGKTTTLNMITNYISQSSGKIIINGKDICCQKPSEKKIIGYLPENPPLYFDMTVQEYLNFVCELKKADKKSLKDIIKKLDLWEIKNKLIKNISKGCKQRVGLAQALIGNPEILILDEPNSGLDPKQRIKMRDLIKSLKQNHTILISSHILSEINEIADRLIIINKGKIVADNTPDQLAENLTHGKKIIARLKGNPEEILAALYENDFLECVDYKKNVEDGCMDLVFKNKNPEQKIDLREQIFMFAKENNFILLMSKPFGVSLEEIFLKITDENQTSENKNLENQNLDSEEEKNNESDL